LRTSPGAWGGTARAACPGVSAKCLVVTDELGKALRAECRDEIDPPRLPLRAPCRQERLEAGALAGAALLAVGHEVLDEDVEVADVAQPGPDVAKLVAIAPPRITLEPVAEDPPRGAHPACRDPHRVDLLGVLAGDDTRHAREHLRQVKAQDLAPGFRPRIVGPEAGGSALCKARRRQDDLLRRDGRHHVALERLGGVGLGHRRPGLARTLVGLDRA
jgi:hypothetical protein